MLLFLFTLLDMRNLESENLLEFKFYFHVWVVELNPRRIVIIALLYHNKEMWKNLLDFIISKLMWPRYWHSTNSFVELLLNTYLSTLA